MLLTLETTERLFRKLLADSHMAEIHVWNNIFRVLDARGHIWQFEVYLRQMEAKGLQPNMETYTILISSFRRHGAREKVYQLFGQIRKAEIVPSIQIWTEVMEQLDADGESAKVLDYAQEMAKQGLVPNLIVYRLLAKCLPCIPEKSEAILRLLASIGTDLSPDVQIYSHIITCFRRLGFTTPKELADAVLGAGLPVNTSFFVCLMEDGIYADSNVAVEAAYNAITEYSLMPDDATRVALAKMYVNKGHIELAFDVAVLSFSKPLRELQAVLIRGFLAYFPGPKAWRNCIDMFNRKKLRLHVDSFRIFAETLHGNRHELEELLELMKLLAHPSVVVYNMLLRECLEHGDLPAFTLHLQQLRTKWQLQITVETYNMLIEFLGLAGRTEVLAAILQNMKANGVTPTADTAAILISTRMSHGHMTAEEAEQVLNDLRRDGVNIDARAIQPVIHLLLGEDRLRDAFLLLLRARDPKLHDTIPTAKLCAPVLGYVSLRPDYFDELADQSEKLLNRFPESENSTLPALLLAEFDVLCAQVYQRYSERMDTRALPSDKAAAGQHIPPYHNEDQELMQSLIEEGRKRVPEYDQEEREARLLLGDKEFERLREQHGNFFRD